MIRDITFPPDSGCGTDGREKGVELGSQGFNFAGVGLETGTSTTTTSQHLKWQAHVVSTWMDLCDGALQDM